MLVVTRNNGQRLRIGPDIVVTLLRGNNVRLGIEAPADVRIIRDELTAKEQPDADGNADGSEERFDAA